MEDTDIKLRTFTTSALELGSFTFRTIYSRENGSFLGTNLIGLYLAKIT